MILRNHYLDQDESFQKLLKFRTLFFSPWTLLLNMVCFASDIYFIYSTETVKKLITMLLLVIRKNLQFALAASQSASVSVS